MSTAFFGTGRRYPAIHVSRDLRLYRSETLDSDLHEIGDFRLPNWFGPIL
jgi:hypothetical protein